jgi:hypothetical protein
MLQHRTSLDNLQKRLDIALRKNLTHPNELATTSTALDEVQNAYLNPSIPNQGILATIQKEKDNLSYAERVQKKAFTEITKRKEAFLNDPCAEHVAQMDEIPSTTLHPRQLLTDAAQATLRSTPSPSDAVRNVETILSQINRNLQTLTDKVTTRVDELRTALDGSLNPLRQKSLNRLFFMWEDGKLVASANHQHHQKPLVFVTTSQTTDEDSNTTREVGIYCTESCVTDIKALIRYLQTPFNHSIEARTNLLKMIQDHSVPKR